MEIKDFAFIASVIVLSVVWIEHMSWSDAMKKVQKRHQEGDKTCGIKKGLWLWRVVEYGEE